MKPILELSKPRITQLVVLTTAAGYYLASSGPFRLGVFLATLVGTTLVAAGTNAFNMIRERDIDGHMRRTKDRPLPAGRVSPQAATVFAAVTAAAGIGLLAWRVNLITAALAALTLVTYVWFYTSLKTRSSLNTLVGAVPGALPVLGGWTAAGGTLSAPAFALFGTLFLWQLPHFLALAWVYRDDYRTAQLRMLSVEDTDGHQTARMAILYAVALIPVSLLPTLLGVTGRVYFWGALALGLAYAGAGVLMLFDINRRAWTVFLVSIIYLPMLLTLAVLNKVTA
ncbi:MAG TPA: heme o synthase [Gemmatimonadales bacterium]|nr:heme o synthase [Gemmatimonadales bacterium]